MHAGNCLTLPLALPAVSAARKKSFVGHQHTLAMEEQTAAVAPVETAGCDTSMRKKCTGAMGGRTMYSLVATSSTDLHQPTCRGHAHTV